MKKSIVPLKIWVVYVIVVVLSVAAVFGMLFINVDFTVEIPGEIVSRSGSIAVTAPANGRVEQVRITTIKKVEAGDVLATISTVQFASLELKAPENGVLMWERELLMGEIVASGEILGVLHPTRDLIVAARLEPDYVENIYAGLPVKIRFDNKASAHSGGRNAVMESVVSEVVWQKTDKGVEPFALIALTEITGEILPGFTVRVEATVGRSRLLQGVF